MTDEFDIDEGVQRFVVSFSLNVAETDPKWTAEDIKKWLERRLEIDGIEALEIPQKQELIDYTKVFKKIVTTKEKPLIYRLCEWCRSRCKGFTVSMLREQLWKMKYPNSKNKPPRNFYDNHLYGYVKDHPNSSSYELGFLNEFCSRTPIPYDYRQYLYEWNWDTYPQIPKHPYKILRPNRTKGGE